MTVLGYDPAELARLHLHLRATLDELQQVARADSGTHPAVAEAIAVVRRAVHDIDSRWLPLAQRVLATDPLRVRGDGTDLFDTTVVRLDVAGVGALARMLDTANLDELVADPSELRVLAAELQLVAGDSTRRATFGRHFHEWARLADALATARMFREGDGDTADVAAIDAVLAGLAGALRGGELGDTIAVLDQLHPYSAALVVQYLQLDPTTLAEVADRLVARWCDQPWSEYGIGSPSQFAERSHPNPADVLFPLLLAAGPEAAVRYVALAGAHPQALFAASTDPALAHQLMRTATDPANVPAATSGALLVPILDWFRTGYDSPAGTAVYDADALLFVIDLMAPWTMELGPMATAWGLDLDHKAEIMAFLVSTDAAIDRLLANLGGIRDSVLAHVRQGDAESLAEFACYFGFLTRSILDERVRDEERLAAAWSFTVNLLSVGVSAISLGTTAAITSNLAIIGLGALPVADVEGARTDAEYVSQYAHAVAAAAVAHTVYQQWLLEGVLQAQDCPPPPTATKAAHPADAFHRDYQQWLHVLPGGFNGELATRVDRLVQMLLNADFAGTSAAH